MKKFEETVLALGLSPSSPEYYFAEKAYNLAIKKNEPWVLLLKESFSLLEEVSNTDCVLGTEILRKIEDIQSRITKAVGNE